MHIPDFNEGELLYDTVSGEPFLVSKIQKGLFFLYIYGYVCGSGPLVKRKFHEVCHYSRIDELYTLSKK